jgi:hypothetical protein
MEQSLWAADSPSAGLEIPRLLRNPKTTNRLYPERAESSPQPHVPFDIILSPMPVCPFVFRPGGCIYFCLPNACCRSRHPILLYLFTQIYSPWN